MAEAEKTSKVFVRLTRDFPVGGTHRRGGVTLGTGPQPVEVEVTKDQLEALKGDRYVEIVSAKEAKKWEERLGQPEQPTSADLAAEGGDKGGRNYGDGEGDDGGSSDGSDGSGEGDDTPEFSPATPLKELQAEAARLGIENPEQFRSKQAAFDAIEAKKAEAPADGEGDDGNETPEE